MDNPENAKYHIYQALDSIPDFKAAREGNNIKVMAELYRKYVIGYKAQDKQKYNDGQLGFFFEIGGLRGLITSPKEFLGKTSSPAAVLRFALPGLIDDGNPDALRLEEVTRGIGYGVEGETEGSTAEQNQAMNVVGDRIHEFWLKIEDFRGDNYISIVRAMINDNILKKYVSWHERERINDHYVTFYWRKRALEVLLSDIGGNYRLEVEGRKKARLLANPKRGLPKRPRVIADDYQDYVDFGPLLNLDERATLGEFILTLRVMNAQERNAMSAPRDRWDVIERIGASHHLQPGHAKELIQTIVIPWVLKHDPTGPLANAIKVNRDSRGVGGTTTVKKQNAGGIDLTSNKFLQTQNAGAGIKFHLDPAMLEQLRRAPGFVPVIINIQPMTDLRVFLGLADNQVDVGASG